MSTDSFESLDTLAACEGDEDLALLLIERSANIEEVNDENYTSHLEAAREGHEDTVAVIFKNGMLNAQTEETEEKTLTLARGEDFLEVVDFLIKNGAELELGASTLLIEAAQKGHLDLVKYLLETNADVNAQTQTGDTALTYSCENGHTEVAKLALSYNANLEHKSEGGYTPLMKACRAGHLCTVKFLLSQNADVNTSSTSNDHTPLSLASAGGHIAVVELLLTHQADPFHKLKDNSTMLIEAAKGGHTKVAQLLLDYPHSIMMSGGAVGGRVPGTPPTTAPTATATPISATSAVAPPPHLAAAASPPNTSTTAGLQKVPDAVKAFTHDDVHFGSKATSSITAGYKAQLGDAVDSSQAVVNGGTESGNGGVAAAAAAAITTAFSSMDVDSATDSTNDTALTIACAGGHEELVELLISRGASIEHRDIKGFTPLILAATAGYETVCTILLNHTADMEAQSEKTGDTPLSLACSSGRYEVVELLLSRGAICEYRNASDYTPLSLAAAGGYLNIIQLLLSHGAEINSRTGSKYGIAPLMLAAVNGHTAAVKLLLDMGADINAQIVTNRNTALTLACFQGKHEVVSLLLDRKANVEHRATTGLTPLMEAASEGFVEVGRVLLDKGADVNAPPVPSSRDTALTIAADKGHCQFVKLLLNRLAQVEGKNKKGNSPLWLAANGGHLAVVELLYEVGADIDSQDNRKVSCLMAAFRKGHVKVVKWMVNHVMQFPSDQEMIKYITTVSDKELLEKCQECIQIIHEAKDQQAAKANKNASMLLEELFLEKMLEEKKKAVAVRRRERKRIKKIEKKEEKRKQQEQNQKFEMMTAAIIVGKGGQNQHTHEEKQELNVRDVKKNAVSNNSGSGSGGGVSGDSPGWGIGEGEGGYRGIDASSQVNCSSNDVKPKAVIKRKQKKKKKQQTTGGGGSQVIHSAVVVSQSLALSYCTPSSSKEVIDREGFELTGSDHYISNSNGKKSLDLPHNDESGSGKSSNSTNGPKQDGNSSSNSAGGGTSSGGSGGSNKRDEGWKEVVRKCLNSPFRSKKVSVPLNAIGRVIGRGGSNINTIRNATGAQIEVEKQSIGHGERIFTLKGSSEETKQAHSLIAALIQDPDVDIQQLLPKSAKSTVAVWEKSVYTAKSKPSNEFPGGASSSSQSLSTTGSSKGASSGGQAVKRAQLATSTSIKTTMSYTSAIMTPTGSRGNGVTFNSGSSTKSSSGSAAQSKQPSATSAFTNTSQTFTAKPAFTESAVAMTTQQQPLTAPTLCKQHQQIQQQQIHQQQQLQQHHQPQQVQQHVGEQQIVTSMPSATVAAPETVVMQRTCGNSMPLPPAPTPVLVAPTTREYSLFNDTFTKIVQQSLWGRGNGTGPKCMNFASVAAATVTGSTPCVASTVQTTACNTFLDSSPPQVDASKAPGYRGNNVAKVGGGGAGRGQEGGVQVQHVQSAASIADSPISTSLALPLFPNPLGVEAFQPSPHLMPPPPFRPVYPTNVDHTMMTSYQQRQKVPPRPIGTERRAWKNYAAAANTYNVQTNPSWMLKTMKDWPMGATIAPPSQTLDMHHIFRQTPNLGVSMSRIPMPNDIHLMDSPYQGSLDSGRGLMHSLPVLTPTQHYSALPHDLQDQPWDQPMHTLQDHPTLQDKQHGWTTKWIGN